MRIRHWEIVTCFPVTMSYPLRPSIEKFTYDEIIKYTHSVLSALPDSRTGKNTVYSMADAGLGAFSVFFTQSPSFLDFQRTMELAKGNSNAQTLFGMLKIPCDNQIRNLLDGVPPSALFELFAWILDGLKRLGYLDNYQSIDGTLLVAMDGTQYFSSNEIHCDKCTVKRHKNGSTSYSHAVITPVITAPGTHRVFPLEPEFIVPQDGHEKQDCENAAAKRWLQTFGPRYRDWKITVLGDDLYCKQPLCEAIQAQGMHFILVCKPESHRTLYEWVEGLDVTDGVKTVTLTRRKGKRVETDTYRFCNEVPLRDGDDALHVNWCELTTRDAKGKILYKNAFATSYTITEHNVAEIARAGRARWKVENENNNTLKTKGYHLTHNFGHGKNTLSAVLATLNLFAFLVHTVLEMADVNYQCVRKKLATRVNFFNDIRALTRYLCFDSWGSLLLFMMRQLEISPPDTT